MSRDHVLLFEDIEQSCAKIVNYTEGYSKDQVLGEELGKDAVLLNLHIIGEAAKKLSSDFRERYPEVAWREIAGPRDFIAHAYFASDFDNIWDAMKHDVPALFTSVKEIMQTEQQGEAK